MKLFYSPTSPFVRKVSVTAMEKGVNDRIERIDAAANPIDRDQRVVTHNPSGKVPCMLTDEGMALYDSRVICAYIDSLSPEPALMPADAVDRMKAMTLEALADAILDAAVLCRYEVAMRPEEKRWNEWYRGQMEKITSGLDALEGKWREVLAGPMTVGTIAVGCALGYLDFRFADMGWRETHPALAQWYATFGARPSMTETVPQG